MDHRTTSQEASPNGHQKPESVSRPKCEHGFPISVECGYCEELKAAYERIAKLEADLHECLEYIEQEVDVVDGDYGQPSPNRAMQLVSMIDETLNGPGVV